MPPARGLILLYSASEVLPVSAACSENVPTVSGRRFRISMRISSGSVMCRFGTGARSLLLLAMSLVEITAMGLWDECCFLTKVVLFFNIRIHVHSYACVCIHMHFIVFCMHSDALHSTNRLHSNAFCNHFELLHSSDARRLHSDAFSYLLHSRHVTF
jgi:hypothetical protein